MSNTTSSFTDFALADRLAPRVAEFATLDKPPASLSFVEVMKDYKQSQSPKQDIQASPFTQLAQYLKALPENQKVDAKALIDAAKGSNTFGTLEPLLQNSVSVVRTGNHFDIERRENSEIPIERDILEGNASADSLNVAKNIAFDITADGKSISGLEGLSLTVSAFGSDKTIRMTQIDIASGKNDQPALIAHIENPLPDAARDILSMPASIAVPIESNKNGLSLPQPSSIFHAAAESAGDTLPGLLFSDAFNDLGDVSKFAEENPKWIHDVIKPMFEEVKKQATSQTTSHSQTDSSPHSASNNRIENQSVLPADSTKNSDKASSDNAGNNANLEKIKKPGDYEQTIAVDGKDRHYTLHVPPGYDGSKPIPLLVMLHGRGGDGKEFAKRTHMNERADKEGFAVVYPDATKWLGRKDLSAWDAANGLVPPGARANDLKFLRDVIDRSQSQLEVDQKRIYMIGHSSGGMMTYLAASEMSDKLAAVGIVSSAMSGKEPKPKFPVSVISTHGTDDEVIPIKGLHGVPPILSELGIPTFNTPQFATDFWKRQNGITENGTIKQEGDVTEKLYRNTSNGTAVKEITLENSGHTPDEKFDVYDKIWDFLKEHPKSSGNVAPSNDPTELLDNRTNPLQRVLDNIQKRGADGIAEDVAKLYAHAASLPNGAIYPSKMLKNAEDKLGSKLQNPVTDLIDNTTELSKTGNQIRLKTSQPSILPINKNLGIGTIESLNLNNVKFDLDSEKGNPKLSEIEGVSLDIQALGLDRRSNLHSLTDKEDSNGRHTYNFNLDNPVPAPLRWLMLAPSTVNIGMQVDINGNVKIGNEKQLMNELLGRNPITRGYIDQINDINALIRDPASGALPTVRRDIGITSGLSGLGLLAPRYRLPISLLGGLIGAPAVIHFLHENQPKP
jgi:polyhydroxybutyrate depolymerase